MCCCLSQYRRPTSSTCSRGFARRSTTRTWSWVHLWLSLALRFFYFRAPESGQPFDGCISMQRYWSSLLRYCPGDSVLVGCRTLFLLASRKYSLPALLSNMVCCFSEYRRPTSSTCSRGFARRSTTRTWCSTPHAERSLRRTLHWPAVSFPFSSSSSSLPPNPNRLLSFICLTFVFSTPYLVLHSTRGTQLAQDAALASGKFYFFFFFFFFFFAGLTP